MRIRSMAFRGLTRFTGADPVTIDFDAIGPGLIALVGENGAGKSTAMESVPAALYRTFPTRPGSIYDHAHGTDAFIEAAFDDAGDEVKVRLAVDAERRVTEGFVFLNGASLTTGRAAEFEAQIERRFGSMPLFLASVFAAQDKSGSFLLKKKADRKSLFIELLGLATLEVMAEAARAQRGETARHLELARARVAAVEAETAELPELQLLLEQASTEVDAAAARVTAARAEEASAVSALERARAAGEKLGALKAAADAAHRELTAADAALTAAKARPAEIDKDYQRRLRFVGETDPEKLKEPARARHRDVMARIAKRREFLEAALADAPDADAARQVLAELADERTFYEDQRKELEDLRRRSAVATNDLVAAEQALKAATETRRKEVERLTRQAGLMEQAPCTEQASWETEMDPHDNREFRYLAGTCPLLADARGAREQLKGLRSEGTQEVEERVAAASRHAADLQNLLTLKESQESPERGLATVAARERDAHAAIAKAEAAAVAREQLEGLGGEEFDADVALERDRVEAETKAAAAKEQLGAIDNDRADGLLEADAAIQAAAQRRADAAGRYDAALCAFEAARQDAGDVDTAIDFHTTAAHVRADAEELLRDLEIHRAGIRSRIEQLDKKASALEGLRAAVATHEMHAGDWALLERALGKDGVQALEIDAAGPEVASLTNELLASCYGPRFSIGFETLREKKSAKGEYSETFDVRVFDAGAERAVEALSGGERVVVGEAIGLAIAILNARKSGIRWETLWRDETAGALDPENAQAYVLMLRRALQLGGFVACIFVAHQEDVWRGADVQLLVKNGTITVMRQDADAAA